MKNICIYLVLLCSIIWLTWCLGSKDSIPTQIPNPWEQNNDTESSDEDDHTWITEEVDIDENIVFSNTGIINSEDLYEIDIPSNLWEDGFYQSDLDWFKLIKKDEDFFNTDEKVDEKEFFQLWSDYLFGTNYSQWKYDPLFLCLEGNIGFASLEDEFSRKICQWSLVEEDQDYIALKKSFFTYKEIIESSYYEPSTFIEYTILRSLEDSYSEDLFMKDYFYYNTAKSSNSCWALDSNLLIEVCKN